MSTVLSSVEIENGEVVVNGYTLNQYGEVCVSDEQYDEMLDDCHGLVEIAGLEYSTSYALKAVDPIAYNVGKCDYESSLSEDIESEIESFIEQISDELDAQFDCMTETNSDYAHNIMACAIEGGSFDYHHTNDHMDALSLQLKRFCGLTQYDDAPTKHEDLQGFTFEQVKNKALELLSEDYSNYCDLVFTDSYFSHKDQVYSLNIGELEFECEALADAPKWLIERFNQSIDYTISRGYAYRCINGLEAILHNHTDLFFDAIEALKGE